MIIVFLGIVLVIFSIFMFLKYKFSLYYLSSFIVASTLFVELIAIGVINVNCTTSGVELVSSQEIIALSDSSSVSGNFFLGCGSVDSNEYYSYYIENEYGYVLQKVDANSSNLPVYIKYISDNETPHIDIYKTVSRVKKKPNFIISLSSYFYFKNKDIGDIIGDPSKSGRIEIYIPEGSIKNNYNINLK